MVGNDMTVAELKKMLENYPDEMEIVNRRYSDYWLIAEDEWSIINGVARIDGYIMSSHPTMNANHKFNEKSSLALYGN